MSPRELPFGARTPERAARAAAPGRKEHERGGFRVVLEVADAQHAAVAVADDDRRGKAPLGHEGRGAIVVGDCLAGQLKRAALGDAAVAGAQDVVPPPIEREAGVAEARQHGRQEPQRPHVEVHRVAMEQQNRPAHRPVARNVQQPVERDGVGGD